MIVNMGFVDMGADDIGVIALGEALGQLTAQTVRVLWCDLSGNEGLPQMVGDHIILAAHSAGLLDVLILGEKKLGVGDSAVALPARNQPAAVRLLRMIDICLLLEEGSLIVRIRDDGAPFDPLAFVDDEEKI